MAEWDTVFSFTLPTTVVFGPDCLGRAGELLGGLGASRPLVVTDPGIVKAGIPDRLFRALGAERRAKLFDEVEPNPKDHNVAAAAAAYRRFGADSIIALGGGSPIDCAKAAGVLIAHNAEDIKQFEGSREAAAPIPPLMTIPTTSGTGSELTFSAVITDTANHYKMTVKSAHTAAKIALCDPILTLSVSPAVTAATGMDALTHAIEAYTARCAEPMADAVALYAVELIAGNLPAAFHDGADLSARSAMLMGSMLAGIAFSHADVASVHCVAEALGGRYDLPHGLCNAVILPHMMEYNLDYCPERYGRIARAMGCAAEGDPAGRLPATEARVMEARAAVAEVRRLAALLKLPSFPDLGIPPNDYPAIAEASERNGSNASNPRPMGRENYLEILKRMEAAR
jgi:alcohol dehydrogenase